MEIMTAMSKKTVGPVSMITFLGRELDSNRGIIKLQTSRSLGLATGAYTCMVFQCCGKIFKNSHVFFRLNFRVKLHQSAAVTAVMCCIGYSVNGYSTCYQGSKLSLPIYHTSVLKQYTMLM